MTPYSEYRRIYPRNTACWLAIGDLANYLTILMKREADKSGKEFGVTAILLHKMVLGLLILKGKSVNDIKYLVASSAEAVFQSIQTSKPHLIARSDGQVGDNLTREVLVKRIVSIGRSNSQPSQCVWRMHL
jgi:hypothetical protein